MITSKSIRNFYSAAGVTLCLHVIVSLAFIVFPTFMDSSLISKTYKRYLLPGPFFSADRVSEYQTSLLSWKVNGQWSEPIEATRNTYRDFFSSGDLTKMYQARLERTLLYYGAESDEIRKKEKLKILNQYYRSKYVPGNADSIQLIIIQKKSKDYSIRLDTLTRFVF